MNFGTFQNQSTPPNPSKALAETWAQALENFSIEFDRQLLESACMNLRSEPAKISRTYPDGRVEFVIEQDERINMSWEFEFEGWHATYGWAGERKIEDSPLLRYLSQRLNLRNALIVETNTMINYGADSHHYDGHFSRSLIVASEFSTIAQLAITIPLMELEKILFHGGDIAMQVALGVARLGAPANNPVQGVGGKAQGFILLEKVGLPFPPGIVLSADLVKLIINTPQSLAGEDREPFRAHLEFELERVGITKKDPLIVRSNPLRSMPGVLESVSWLPALSNRNCVKLDNLINAVRVAARAWDTPKAKQFRSMHAIPEDFNLSLIVQRNISPFVPSAEDAQSFAEFKQHNREIEEGVRSGCWTSAFGAASTRDPNIGTNQLFGSYLPNGRGKDLMLGSHSGLDLGVLQQDEPALFAELMRAKKLLDAQVGPQELEFLMHKSKQGCSITYLQTRNLHFSPQAEAYYLNELLTDPEVPQARLLDRLEALEQRTQVRRLYRLRSDFNQEAIANSTYKTTGCLQGRLAWSFEAFDKYKAQGEPIVCFADHYSAPWLEKILDYPHSALVTFYGDQSSHEATVCRLVGIPALINLKEAKLNKFSGCTTQGGLILKEGDLVIVDANSGNLFLGKHGAVELDDCVQNNTFGLSICSLRQEFLASFLSNDGSLRSEFSLPDLREMDREAAVQFEILKNSDDARASLLANFRKHWLHGLILRLEVEG